MTEESGDAIDVHVATTSNASGPSGIDVHVADTNSITIPDLSSGVKSALIQGNSSEVWSQLIDELLTFYTRKFPHRLQCSQD